MASAVRHHLFNPARSRIDCPGEPHFVLLMKDRKFGDKLGDEAESPRYILTELGVGYRMPKDEMPGMEPDATP